MSKKIIKEPTFLEKHKRWIIPLDSVIGVVLIAFIVFLFTRHHPPVSTPGDRIKQAVDSAVSPLKRENARLHKENDSLHLLFTSTEKRNVDLKSQIIKSKYIISNIQKKYNEKISSVDYYTPADIDSFLSKRYHR